MHDRKLVFAAACLGMLMFGIAFTTLGAILPSVIEEFGIDKANAGSLFLLLTAGMLLGSVIFGPIVDRHGYKRLLTLGAALILAGLEGIAYAPSFLFLRVAVLIIGFGGGVINGGTNALVADLSEEGRSAGLSILGVFFGIGAVGVPLLLGVLLNAFSYQTIFAGIGLTMLLPLFFLVLLRFPAPKQPQGFPFKKGLGLLKEATLLLMGFILFFQSGMEITVSGWASTFFKEELMLESSRAVLLLSFYWVGMMAARLVLGRVLKTTSPAAILILSIGTALVGAVAMISSKGPVPATAALLLIGAGLAAGFPVILGHVGDLYSRLSGTAFSIVLVLALMGGMALPYLTGVLSSAYGLRLSFVIIPVSLIGAAVLYGIAHSTIRSKEC